MVHVLRIHFDFIFVMRSHVKCEAQNLFDFFQHFSFLIIIPWSLDFQWLRFYFQTFFNSYSHVKDFLDFSHYNNNNDK